MGIIAQTKRWLAGTFKSSSEAVNDHGAKIFSTPEDVFYPGEKAPLLDHVRFLLDAKQYIQNHPVPEDRLNALNQYSHAGSPPIGDDPTKPAITNCSYEYFGRKLISIGFPLFTKQAPMIKNNDINPAFNNVTLWESTRILLEKSIGNLGDGETKYGYYLPTHHSYIEKPVPEDVFEKSQKIIELYARTDICDPQKFLTELNRQLAPSPLPDRAPSPSLNLKT